MSLVLLGLIAGAVVLGGAMLLSDTPVLGDSIYSFDYKDDNMTAEFKDGETLIGQATLKSHKTYDEILEITSGENRIVIWYEFSGFKDVQLDALKGVEFIDMRTEATNESAKGEPVLIPNPNYGLPILKEYRFVYLDGKGEWLPYNSLNIPKENITLGVQTDLGWGEYLDIVWNIFGDKIGRHGLTIGTNCGFVTEAPEGDPYEFQSSIDNEAKCHKHTSPADSNTVTEMGAWIDTATQAADMELGIYEHNVGDDEPEALVGKIIFAKGTSAGWKSDTSSIPITAETVYWLCMQVDDTATATKTNVGEQGGARYVRIAAPQTTLPDIWGASAQLLDGYNLAVYAVWGFVVPDTTFPDSVGFLAPTPANDTNLTQNNYLVNVSFNDTNPGACLLELTNTSGTINYTMTQGANESEWYINTSHSNNLTYFQAYCDDDSGNYNVSDEMRFVNISVTPPPADNTTFNITLPLQTPVQSSLIGPATQPIEINFSTSTEPGINASVVSGVPQNNTYAIFEFKNAGDVNLKWIIELNESTPSCIKLNGSWDSAASSVFSINTTTNATVNWSIAQAEIVSVWIFGDAWGCSVNDNPAVMITHHSQKA